MDTGAAEEIIEILERVLTIVGASPQDLSWQSTYGDEAELIADLRAQIEQLGRGDGSAMRRLRLLFAVTGPLCEIAMSSGWAEEYGALADRFDRIGDAARRE